MTAFPERCDGWLLSAYLTPPCRAAIPSSIIGKVEHRVETPKCTVRTYDCLLTNYSVIDFNLIKQIDDNVERIIGFFAVLYILQILIIIQEVTVITGLFLITVNMLVQEYFFTPIIHYLEIILKKAGYM